MISCDTNVLFTALEVSRPGHAMARSFLEAQGEESDFALCELPLLELCALLRTPLAGVFVPPPVRKDELAERHWRLPTGGWPGQKSEVGE
jgi:predicted nucleic acid-binding protein